MGRDSEIIIKLKYNIASSEESPMKHICDFLLGYFAGFGEFVMYNAKVIEEKCSIEDASSEFCEFIITRRN